MLRGKRAIHGTEPELFPRHEIVYVTMRLLRKRIRRLMVTPPKEHKRAFRRYARGLATEVALSIMSGTDAPWFTVSMRNVHELRRVTDSDAVDANQDESDE